MDHKLDVATTIWSHAYIPTSLPELSPPLGEGRTLSRGTSEISIIHPRRNSKYVNFERLCHMYVCWPCSSTPFILSCHLPFLELCKELELWPKLLDLWIWIGTGPPLIKGQRP